MSERNPYHHGNLREALLKAAIRLIAEVGPTAFTLREVARRAGVSHNAPYRHFEDKEALLAAVATEGFLLLSAALRDARANVEVAEERFVRTGVAYLRFAQEHRGYLAVMHGPAVAKRRTAALQN